MTFVITIKFLLKHLLGQIFLGRPQKFHQGYSERQNQLQVLQYDIFTMGSEIPKRYLS